MYASGAEPGGERIESTGSSSASAGGPAFDGPFAGIWTLYGPWFAGIWTLYGPGKANSSRTMLSSGPVDGAPCPVSTGVEVEASSGSNVDPRARIRRPAGGPDPGGNRLGVAHDGGVHTRNMVESGRSGQKIVDGRRILARWPA
jgi:hypothetical protein